MSQIKLKRGMKANLPSSLPLGEPAFCLDTQEMYVGQGKGKPLLKVNAQDFNEIDSKFKQTNAHLSAIKEHCTGGNGMQEHSHVNKTIIDGFDEYDNVLYFKGVELATESYVNQEIEKTNTRIEELFQSVSNGKELLASALTDKGIPTLATESFEEIARKILSLGSGEVEELFNLITKNGDSLVTKNGDNLIYRGVM